jgi:hypothetical protein
MTSTELYKILDKLDLDWSLVELFDGVRVISFLVKEEIDEDRDDA